MPTPIRKRRFGSNNTKKRSRKKNSRKKNSRKKSPRKRSRGNADGVDIGTTTGEAFTPILATDDVEVGKDLEKYLADRGVDATLHKVIAREFSGGKKKIPVVSENGKPVYKTLGELVNQHQQQSVLGKRKDVPLSFPPGAPEREFGPATSFVANNSMVQ